VDGFFVLALTTLLTIVNPLGAMGPFLAMTVHDPPAKRTALALRASVVSALILAGCALMGSMLFRFYGITLPALKVAGGILLFGVAFDMINARPSRSRQTDEEESEGAAKDDVAIFPLAIPLLSGPGAIVSVFMLADRADTLLRQLGLGTAIVVTSLTSYAVLRHSPKLLSILGRIGLNVMARLMGMMLAAIAIQFVIDGIAAAFPFLLSGQTP
jgi:multiple antibiotic resistance protein